MQGPWNDSEMGLYIVSDTSSFSLLFQFWPILLPSELSFADPADSFSRRILEMSCRRVLLWLKPYPINVLKTKGIHVQASEC